ncbi:MAG: 3-keto-5-aminohexanoate cleavage protein [Pseudomonadota bacterium]|jgi:3-keto-5-aminohexanoate cleavage enzyme|nr:3-keto-5-aminohexanoate cleavage protein [Syntrophaceae bacterium]MDI9554883.1 3-keto-5-aminohexanoate cleavage protein [Pseudomonadota bacterium]NLX30822.1 3-keto-5-aminohexanoate cleavage protein [Deltaproteobacteria bacterium]HNZ33875.1 3-keto-5-aminohexanoate cleavage protein [Syntrophales bacterium]HOF74126.1 3-keto-5-aminohexanoate cleavage protein [Syntrophales bacterium]
MEKVIITAAITGSRMMRDIAPYIPITPDEIARSAIEAWQAGASIVHIHVRDPETGLGSQDINLFRRVVGKIREKTDLILSLTTSGIPGRNLPTAERLSPLQLKPELASYDAGSINLGGKAFVNDPAFLDEAARMMKEAGVKPEIEVFDLGMLVTALKLRDEGKIDEPLHFQFCLGTPWGAPATLKSFLHLYEHMPVHSTWSIFGVGRGFLPMAMMGLVMGGHIRVGMEDNIYVNPGVLAKTNAELVERVTGICRAYGRDVATPAEARKILGFTK